MRKISRCLDILWGVESNIYSIYYLNGVDNSLSMISTQILKDISAQFRGSYITAIDEARRMEMLHNSQTRLMNARASLPYAICACIMTTILRCASP
ncbi:MAG: hypothetical protein ACR5LD_08175 [Symbiopectobacterium sp.]